MASRELESILKLKPVLWVGSGLSVAAGYPSKKAFLSILHSIAGDDLPDGDLATTIRNFREHYGSEIDDVLQDVFSPSHKPTKIHEDIARLAEKGHFKAIITTALDDSLEREFKARGIPLVIQTLESNAANREVEGSIRLYKIRGSHNNWNEVALSLESDGAFDARYNFLRAQIDVLVQQHALLFVGCSLQDPWLLQWIHGHGKTWLRNLKRWRALLRPPTWIAANEGPWTAGTAENILSRVPLKAITFQSYADLQILWNDLVDHLLNFSVAEYRPEEPRSSRAKPLPVSRLSWIQISDIGRISDFQWTFISTALKQDVQRLCTSHGFRPQILIITGQLSSNGTPSSFKKLTERIQALQAAEVLSETALVALPGRGDTIRSVSNPLLTALNLLTVDSGFENDFWSRTNSSYRRAVSSQFRNFSLWQKKQQQDFSRTGMPSGWRMQLGALPGDLALHGSVGGFSIELVALNTAIIPSQGYFHPCQLHKLYKENLAERLRDCHVAVLITTDPYADMSPLCKRALTDNALLRDFSVHLSSPGNTMHREAHKGSPLKHRILAPQLGNPEQIGGFLICSIALTRQPSLRVWPRIFCNSGFCPDRSWSLESDEATSEIQLEKQASSTIHHEDVSEQPSIDSIARTLHSYSPGRILSENDHETIQKTIQLLTQRSKL